MKKTSLSYLFGLLVAVMTLTGCSRSSDIYSLASAEDAFALSGNPATVIKNADCKITASGIELSQPLQRVLTAMTRTSSAEVEEASAIQGVDFEKFLFTMSADDDIVFAFQLTDAGKFIDYVKKLSPDAEFNSVDGLKVLDEGHSAAFFIDGNVACLLGNTGSARIDVAAYKQYKEKAAKSPLKTWQKEALDDGNFLNGYVNYKELLVMAERYGVDLSQIQKISYGISPEQLESAFAKFESSLEGASIEGEMQIVDSEGKDIKLNAAVPTVDTSLLRYASSVDVAVAMTAMPEGFDWKDYIESIMGASGVSISESDQEAMATIIDVLEDFDGTIMMAAGPVNVAKISSPAGWHAVAVAQMKPGTAEKYVAQLADMLSQLPSSEMGQFSFHGGVLKLQMSEFGPLTINADGNNFVAVLGETHSKGACTIDTDEFKGANGGLIIDIPKDNLFSSLVKFPFGLKMEVIGKGTKAEFELEETQTNGLFLDNIFKFAVGFAR